MIDHHTVREAPPAHISIYGHLTAVPATACIGAHHDPECGLHRMTHIPQVDFFLAPGHSHLLPEKGVQFEELPYR